MARERVGAVACLVDLVVDPEGTRRRRAGPPGRRRPRGTECVISPIVALSAKSGHTTGPCTRWRVHGRLAAVGRVGVATISFARGIPAPECLAVDDLAECARAALVRDGHTILSYGPSPGYGPLREWLAERHGVDVSRIFLTNGSLQGFVFLARRLAPGKRVLVEEPDL